MSFATQISALVTRIGTEFKSVRAVIGTTTNLGTTAKSDLVSAVNEVNSKVGAIINDATASTSSTYSSSQVNTKISNASAQVKSDIIGGASAAYDTLVELQGFLQNDDTAISGLTTAVGNRLRLDAAGGYTAAQQAQGQSNLNVYSQTQIGDPTTDFVSQFVAALS